MYAPYMTVYLIESLPNIPYIHRIYMVLANPIHMWLARTCLVARTLLVEKKELVKIRIDLAGV